jgi:hypothetical protein
LLARAQPAIKQLGVRYRTSKGLSELTHYIELLVMNRYFSACLQKAKVVVVFGLMRGRGSGETERAKFYPP